MNCVAEAAGVVICHSMCTNVKHIIHSDIFAPVEGSVNVCQATRAQRGVLTCNTL